MKYKLKAEVEAFMWTGNIEDVKDCQWFHQAIDEGIVQIIDTKALFADFSCAHPGQYIVKGWQNKIFSMSKQQFHRYYEPV